MSNKKEQEELDLLIAEISSLCLKASEAGFIPKKITLGKNKMTMMYNFLIKRINKEPSVDKPLSLSAFFKKGCSLNLGYGMTTVEFDKSEGLDYIELESSTEEQLQRQAEDESRKLILEANKLIAQGREPGGIVSDK